MLTIDGSRGEGGGQVLRTSLALSVVTGTPFRVENIRARRRKPGLLNQHLTSVRAAARISRAEVEGDSLGSDRLTFRPREARGGQYAFDVGTAGSTTLVLQAVLPALLLTPEPSRIRVAGGTHNPFAPPFDFIERALVPVLNRMGPRIDCRLERPGFFPGGGGAIAVDVAPTTKLEPLEIPSRGDIVRRRATAIVSRLPESIAARELRAVELLLGWEPSCYRTEVVRTARGPGNVLMVEIESERATEIATAFGTRGVRAENVGERAAGAAKRYLDSGVPVGAHLADQLLVPLALAGAGSFRTLEPSDHTRTNAGIVEEFLDLVIELHENGRDDWTVRVVPR